MEFFYLDKEIAPKTAPRNGSGVKVLIVEDEGIIAMDLSHMAAKLGNDVLGIVYSGEESVREAGRMRPDVILMDIKLKGKIDGIQAALKIRALYNIPVIFISAFSDPVMFEKAQSAKPLAFLKKPFDERELEGVLSEISGTKSSV